MESVDCPGGVDNCAIGEDADPILGPPTEARLAAVPIPVAS